MIHSFSVKNFYSFRDKVEISFKLTQHAPKDERSVQSKTRTRLNKAMAVFGHNASGKTKLMQALVFLLWFINHSFRREPTDIIPFEPHFFSSDDGITEMRLEFDADGLIWCYQVALSRKMVHTESLYKKEKSKQVIVFKRKWNEQSKSYEINGKQQFKGVANANTIRPNASFISIAKQYDIPQALQVISAISQYQTNIDAYGYQNWAIKDLIKTSKFYEENPVIKSKMVKLLQKWDFGLADVESKEITITQSSEKPKNLTVPIGIHTVKKETRSLDFFLESHGTQSAFLLLQPILTVLESGGIAIIDELESGLHLLMLGPILGLFWSKATNPYNAQIIFTSHVAEIMNKLHKGQIILVEKDGNCESHAWRLDQMNGVRADDNFYAKYIAGTYGALPSF